MIEDRRREEETPMMTEAGAEYVRVLCNFATNRLCPGMKFSS